ncbi:MFS general substrate transporter [Auriculariales sp. MPI-PUGE-AT-0066]|nr:MFS general substrate transporter [Auriculariales sp. MPI-PUGE-AT-0066]
MSPKTGLPFAWQARSSIWFITLIVGFARAVDTLCYGMIIPIAPFQLERLGYEDASTKTGYLLFAYSASKIVSTVPISWLSERYGSRKWPLHIGLIALIGTQILFMESKKFWMMLIARAFQGVSTGVVNVVALALLCDTVPEDQIGKQMGLTMALYCAGLILSTPISGVLYGSLGFRAPFIFGIGAAVIDMLGRILVIEKHDADKIRARLAEEIPALSNALAKRVAENDAKPKREESEMTSTPISPMAIEPATSAATPELPLAAPAASIKSAEHVVTRLPPWEVWRRLGVNRRPVFNGLVSLLLSTVISSIEPTFPLRVQGVWHLSATKVGIIYLAGTVPTFLSGPISGWFADRYSPSVVMGSCTILMLPWLYPFALESSLALLIVSLAVLSFFAFSAITPVTTEFAALTRTVPGVGYADSFALFTMAWGGGEMLGPLIGGHVYDSVKDGWVVLCGILAGLVGLAALFASAVGEQPVLMRLSNAVRRRSPSRALRTGEEVEMQQPSTMAA